MSNIKSKLFKLFRKVAPKFNWVLISGNYQVEANTVELANYIAEHYSFKVFFAVDKAVRSNVKSLLRPNVRVVNFGPAFRFCYFTCKYIFATHPGEKKLFVGHLSERQTLINVWHGVGHKKIRLLRGQPGIPADITVATSDLTRKMFAECFGVELSSIFISGYPRNDLMLRAQENASSLKMKLDLQSFDKIVIWLPTFRRIKSGKVLRDGAAEDNPFEVAGFDQSCFNEILKQHNCLCIVKPHYFLSENNRSDSFTNIKSIDDSWLAHNGITLYHLLACADLLITDFSSVMMDFILLEKPVICFCTDLEDYKNTQGLYFEDIENWLPTELIQSHDQFFNYLTHLLETGVDHHLQKRREIRDTYFKYTDANSTKRLTEHVFGHNKS